MTVQYWDKPLIGKNGKKEGITVRKYRDYYFENTDLTLQELADHFGVRESTMRHHSSNFDWDKVLEDITAYESAKIRESNIRKKAELIGNKELSELDLMFQTMTGMHSNYADLQKGKEKIVVDGKLLEREIRPTDKIHADKEHMDGLKKAWDTIYSIQNGGVQKTESKNDNTHTIKENKGIDYFSRLKESESKFDIQDFITED